MAKEVKNWKNVFVLRQEYNPYQKCWFPIIFFWSCSKVCQKSWIECICTDTGDSHYYNESGYDYYAHSRPGTDRCNPAHVKYLLDQYRTDWHNDMDGKGYPVEVKKLNVYQPRLGKDY